MYLVRVQGSVWTVSTTQPITTQDRVKATMLARKERPMAVSQFAAP